MDFLRGAREFSPRRFPALLRSVFSKERNTLWLSLFRPYSDTCPGQPAGRGRRRPRLPCGTDGRSRLAAKAPPPAPRARGKGGTHRQKRGNGTLMFRVFNEY